MPGLLDRFTFGTLLVFSGALHVFAAYWFAGPVEEPVRISVERGQTTVRLRMSTPVFQKPKPRKTLSEAESKETLDAAPAASAAVRERPPTRNAPLIPMATAPDARRGPVLARAEDQAEAEEHRPPPPPQREIAELEPTPVVVQAIAIAAESSPASNQSTGRVDAVPHIVHNPLPPYPAEAGGRFGRPVLAVKVGADGVPREVRVLESSGVAALDESARRTVATLWRFHPAKRNGAAVEMDVQFGVDFHRSGMR